MRVFAVALANASSNSKRGLAVSNREERGLLSAAMLEDVLAALKASVIREVAVVGGSSFRDVADKFGISLLAQGRSGVSSALSKAIKWCIKRKADAVLIIPANIPLISSSDIDRIVTLGSEISSLVLSPSLKGVMNAVFLNPPNLVKAEFGPASFYNLVKAANVKDAVLRFYSSRNLALDFNSDEDFCKLLSIRNDTESKRVFEKINQQRNKKAKTK